MAVQYVGGSRQIIITAKAFIFELSEKHVYISFYWDMHYTPVVTTLLNFIGGLDNVVFAKPIEKHLI